MERNTILAIVLSIAVLFSYDVFVAGPQRAAMLKKAKESKELKTVENKEVTSKTTDLVDDITKNASKSTEKAILPIKTNISNHNYSLFGSNVGGALHNIKFLSAHHPMPIFDLLTVEGTQNDAYVTQKTDDKTVEYVYKTSSLEIIKKFEFLPNAIKVRMEINAKDASLASAPLFKAFEIDASRLEESNKRETMLDEYSANVDGKITRKGGASKFSPKESKIITGKAEWVNFRDHYHAFTVKPLFETKNVEFKQLSEKTLSVYIAPKDKQQVYEFIVYAGPQDKALMKKVDESFGKVLAFSSFLPLEWIAQAIYHLTLIVQSIIKSWGISIILMSVLVYGMTYPLTLKSMLSMRRMQQMQPKINALRERFKNDPQKLNTEIVEIYRREKINPFGGCLPMLLQMPFFMAIYQVLWRAQYFQGKSFLWMQDLSQPDRLFILPFSLPFLGNDLNILPLVMGGVMFWQQKLSAKSAVITDETQAMQQKIMTVFFPIFIAFIFYKFASSLSLYFTMFYFFSAMTQWKMNKTK